MANLTRNAKATSANVARSDVIANLWSPDNLPWRDGYYPWQDNENAMNADGINLSRNAAASGTNLTRN